MSNNTFSPFSPEVLESRKRALEFLKAHNGVVRPGQEALAAAATAIVEAAFVEAAIAKLKAGNNDADITLPADVNHWEQADAMADSGNAVCPKFLSD